MLMFKLFPFIPLAFCIPDLNSKNRNLFPKLGTIESALALQSLPPHNAMCHLKRGKYIEEECLQFVSGAKPFHEARSFCQRLGGDLWVPRKHEAFVFQKIFLYFPEAFVESLTINETVSLGWTGVILYSPITAFSVNEEDYSEDSLFMDLNLNQPFELGCGSISSTDAKIHVAYIPCESQANFFCEYNNLVPQ